jgi:uncharacterized glyoxalase superfamily protein PhnB
MKLASRLTYWGLCREAMSFYCETFGFEIEELVTYGENDALGIPLVPEHKELIDHAVLVHPSGFRLVMSDSITLLFSEDPMQEINAGHLSQCGCREGASMEIFGLSESEITGMYQKLMENRSIPHFKLGAKDGLKLYTSVMDRFNLCWNLSCE